MPYHTIWCIHELKYVQNAIKSFQTTGFNSYNKYPALDSKTRRRLTTIIKLPRRSTLCKHHRNLHISLPSCTPLTYIASCQENTRNIIPKHSTTFKTFLNISGLLSHSFRRSRPSGITHRTMTSSYDPVFLFTAPRSRSKG